MPLFEYEGRTQEGETQIGRVDAVNREAALEILQRNNLIVVNLESIDQAPILSRRLKIFEHVNKKEISIFSRQLSTLFQASVPLVVSVRTLSNQAKSPKLKEALLAVASGVDGGMPFSQALEQHPEIFSNFYIQMVRAGEESGTLGKVLGYLAEYTERDYYIISKIKGAMTYPAFIVGVFILVGTGMLVFVIPQMLSVLEQAGTKDLPTITKVVKALSDFTVQRWPVLAVSFPILVFSGWKFFKTPTGQNLWSKGQLRIPVFGKLFKNIYMFRFSSSFGMLVRGGIPVNRALEITSNVIDNVVYKKVVMNAQDKVSKGESIAKALGE
ncbi:MAG: type II secretion system F family protein, partial [Candidatus Spechtbacteria bacterium]|nr:type II secretion system F family protein [Candidatus Spechtbacteria bacterium]